MGFEGQVVLTRQLHARQTQTFTGGSWIHYFQPSDESLFAGVGGGAVTRSTYSYACGLLGPEPCPAVMPPEGTGLAVRFQLGYQAHVFQVVGHALFGKLRDGSQDLDFQVSEVGIALQATRY